MNQKKKKKEILPTTTKKLVDTSYKMHSNIVL